MKVTVDLTVEQADAYTRVFGTWPLANTIANGAAMAVCDAIVAARPKPLKVGDQLLWKGTTRKYGVLAHGKHQGHNWIVVEGDRSGPYFYLDGFLGEVTMADGSPIVWPT